MGFELEQMERFEIDYDEDEYYFEYDHEQSTWYIVPLHGVISGTSLKIKIPIENLNLIKK